MGLFPWSFASYLQKKFWVMLQKDGFMKTYLRGHTARRHSQYIGGLDEAVKCQGMDEFGNKYYEDFDVSHRNQRRWVEYSDYFISLGITGDRIPPAWHGWMCHAYDDVPSKDVRNFVNHSYQKPHTENTSYTPLHHKPYGSPANLDRMEFIQSNVNRRGDAWVPPQAGSELQGKKVVVEKQGKYEDLLQQ